ncbi:MAG: tRNA (adenosine(37)-N6)-threonylcarbamoyltransferase complex ATPase subunit type 1 TsaE [Thermodesulfobacteriota bacterium]
MSKRDKGAKHTGEAAAAVKKYITASPEETEALAAGLAAGLRAGEVIGLVGELGGGKTCFVRGLARGLAVRGCVKSPSFNILNIYEGGPRKLPLYHMDLYRLSGEADFFEAGLEEYIYSEGISVIEWADKAPGILQGCALVVKFRHAGESRREIIVEKRRGFE